MNITSALENRFQKHLKEKNNISIVKFSQPNLMHKSIKVHHLILTGLLDTASDATIFNIRDIINLVLLP